MTSTLLAALWLAVITEFPKAQAAQVPVGCEKLSTALDVLNLSMNPDPTLPGRPVQQWTVRFQSRFTRNCSTKIEIWDETQQKSAGVAFPVVVRGVRDYTFPAPPGYRFPEPREIEIICYRVRVNISETPQGFDFAKRFCARLKWTLR